MTCFSSSGSEGRLDASISERDAAAARHLVRVPEEAEPGDVGGGMDLAAQRPFRGRRG